MDGIYNTDYWRSSGGVLPRWIIGTAGAVRYGLPPTAAAAKAAKTDVYGYLLATVNPDHTIEFKFHEMAEADTPAPVVPLLGGFRPPVLHREPAEVK